ncbi:MAG: flavoprotein [Egibacteraceae bacterium]
MSTSSGRPVLYSIVCGARPSAKAGIFVRRVQAAGWEVCVIATPQAMKFIDVPAFEGLTGYPVRSEYKLPDEPDVLPPADALVVAPATFNTINKWATGITDTLALGLACEVMGMGLPIVAAPFPNTALARHPAFARSVAELRACGVQVLYDPEMYLQLEPGTGPPAAMMFDWDAVFDAFELAASNRHLPTDP